MFRYFPRLFMLLVFLCVFFPGFSQQDTVPDRKLILKFSPQHLFLGGYHLSLEKSLPHNSSQSIIVAPHLYHGNTKFLNAWSDRYSEEDDNGQVTGYGADIQHRFYLQQKTDNESPIPYVAYGLSYSTFNIGFEKKDWTEELESDGLYYYRHKTLPFNEKVNRFGVSALIGMQGPFLSENIVAELYAGVGYKHSNSTSNHRELRYNKTILDFGYTGLQPLMGFNIGYAF